jgi:CPA1 family monovalent cation:H+ antiporter
VAATISRVWVSAVGGGVFDEVERLTLLLLVALGVALVSRWLRLPYTLALVLVGLVIGLLRVVPSVGLDPDVVLLIFLPALLFEGAWNVRTELLAADWLAVLLLAGPGLGLSLVIVAAALRWGIGVAWLTALLVAAIVSPTDPVAVLALLRQLRMPARLRTIVEAESLFNDGIGAAAYEIVLGALLAALGLAGGHLRPPAWETALEAVWLVVGGPLLGIVVGFAVGRLLALMDDHLIEITVTFGTAYGVYLLGVQLHTSGLLAVVAAGLVLGSYGRRVGMSQRTRAAATDVWEFVGYVANSLLFLLVGLQIGAARSATTLPAIAWAVAGVLVGRVALVYTLLPLHNALARWSARHSGISPLRRWLGRPTPIPSSWRPLLLFAGLRGALSLALVLSLPAAIPQRPELTGIVYGVVLVTLLGQGIVLRVLLPRWARRQAAPAGASHPASDPAP